MARIRSIKPELRTSITVSLWPREVRYFFVLLWGYFDDYGRGVDDTMLIAADCFPRDRDVSPERIDEWLETIAESGPICRYEVDGRPYLHAPNWREHQRPQHPTRSKIPPCPDDEPDDFEMWRKENPERITRRSRKSREELRKIPTGLSGASSKPSGSPSGAPSEPVGAIVIQMPGQTAIDDFDEDISADESTSGNPRESLMNRSGGTQEEFTPEQGSKGAGSKGARERERAGAGTRASATPPAARSRPDGRHPIPDNFGLTPAMRRIAAKTFPGLELDYEMRQFIRHYRAEGTRKRNWPEEWTKWLERSAKWASENAARAAADGHQPHRDFPDSAYANQGGF